MADEQLSDAWRTAINALADSADDVLKAGVNPADRPAELFHFTDAEGLLGILRTKTLRASLATALNDRSEVAYGIGLARSVLADSNVRASEPFRQATDSFLAPEPSPDATRVDSHPYVVSLCAGADQAIHWLHYGLSGTGIALGFDSHDVQVKPFDLFPVIYDLPEQRRLIGRLVETVSDKLLSEVHAVPKNKHKDFDQAAAQMTADFMRLLAPRLKNPAFAAEQEWRLLTLDLKGERVTPTVVKHPTLFRTIAGRAVPYVELTFETLPLTQLILGASGSMQPDDLGLAILLAATMGRSVPVSVSQVPVRP